MHLITRFFFICAGLEGSKNEDFFGSFDGVKGSHSGGGDGFDAAAMSSAWGDPVPSSDPPVADVQERENAFEGVEPDVEDGSGDPKRSQESDQRRSSRRRQPGARPSRSNRGGVEAGMESIKISDAENGGGESEGRDRRDRRGEDPRKRSSSRSKRKARGHRDPRSDKNG